nr:efflux pump apf11 [Quercus suber]
MAMGILDQVSRAKSLVREQALTMVFSLPLGVCALILLFLFLPVGFPNLEATKAQIELSKLFEIDAFGALLVFGACAFIVSALEESGAAYSWDSATIIVLVVLSGASALIFPFWEFAIHRRWKTIQAIFPWRLLTHRVFMGAFMACFLAGVNVTVSVIQIPQEWQTVFGTSALEAGIRLLPFTLSYAAGTILSMILATKLKVPPVFVVLSGGILQSVATCVIALLPVRGGAGKYVCECISGVGAGQNIGVLVQLIPQLITGPDQGEIMLDLAILQSTR